MRGFVVTLVPKNLMKETTGEISQEDILSNSVATPVIAENEDGAAQIALESNPDYTITGIISYELLKHMTALIVNLAAEHDIEIEEQVV